MSRTNKTSFHQSVISRQVSKNIKLYHCVSHHELKRVGEHQVRVSLTRNKGDTLTLNPLPSLDQGHASPVLQTLQPLAEAAHPHLEADRWPVN